MIQRLLDRLAALVPGCVRCASPACGEAVRRDDALNVLGPDESWLVCSDACYRAELRRLRRILAFHGS